MSIKNNNSMLNIKTENYSLKSIYIVVIACDLQFDKKLNL